MLLVRRTVLAALLFSCFGGLAIAADEECPEPTVPPAVIGELTGWIALHTMYDASGLVANVPRISFC